MEQDLKSASDSMHTSTNSPAFAPKSTSKQNYAWLHRTIVVLVIILIIAGSFAVWKLTSKKQSSAPATIASKPAVPEAKIDVPSEPLNQTYTSTKLSVAFKYPFGWKVTEANDGIKVESPTFTYNALQAGNIAGNFRIYIRQGARPVDGKYIGTGVAIKPSEKLTYTQPAIGQRKDTLLSVFGANDSANFSFFLIAGNFQLQKEQTLGPAYGREAETYIIAGGYSLPSATDDLATIPVSLNYYASTNAFKLALETIASLQLK